MQNLNLIKILVYFKLIIINIFLNNVYSKVTFSFTAKILLVLFGIFNILTVKVFR